MFQPKHLKPSPLTRDHVPGRACRDRASPRWPGRAKIDGLHRREHTPYLGLVEAQVGNSTTRSPSRRYVKPLVAQVARPSPAVKSSRTARVWSAQRVRGSTCFTMVDRPLTRQSPRFA